MCVYVWGFGDFVQFLWSLAASSCTREARALGRVGTEVLVVRRRRPTVPVATEQK